MFFGVPLSRDRRSRATTMPVLFPNAVSVESNVTLFGLAAFAGIYCVKGCDVATVADASLRRGSTQSGRWKWHV